MDEETYYLQCLSFVCAFLCWCATIFYLWKHNRAVKELISHRRNTLNQIDITIEDLKAEINEEFERKYYLGIAAEVDHCVKECDKAKWMLDFLNTGIIPQMQEMISQQAQEIRGLRQEIAPSAIYIPKEAKEDAPMPDIGPIGD